MRICVLQPSYEGSSSDYQLRDPRRDLSHVLPDHVFHHEYLKKASTVRQIEALARQDFDIYVNLCEGYRDSDVPSVEVIEILEQRSLPFTGPVSTLYDPPKDQMKLVASSSGVAVAAHVLVEHEQDVANAARLRFPLFVKPADLGDSMGIDEHSLVTTVDELARKAAVCLRDHGRVLVEQYVDGPEFTVLVCASLDSGGPPKALLPLEFRFPTGARFKTYDLKVRQFHPECNVPCVDAGLDARLRQAAVCVFSAFSARGYARMDFRVSPRGGIIFLEANFTCSVFYPDGYQGSADYILQFDGLGQAGFLRWMIAEGLARPRGNGRASPDSRPRRSTSGNAE